MLWMASLHPAAPQDQSPQSGCSLVEGRPNIQDAILKAVVCDAVNDYVGGAAALS